MQLPEAKPVSDDNKIPTAVTGAVNDATEAATNADPDEQDKAQNCVIY